MQAPAGVAVRSSWAEPAAAAAPVSPFGQFAQPPSETQGWEAPRVARQKPVLRVRRPAAAATAAAPPPQPEPAEVQQQHAQPPPPAQQPPPFTFGTPGAGSSGSAVKSRRPKGRTPLPVHSPAFTSSSAASMAWSPYPSSTAEASTTFRGATPPVPSSATPTSGPAGLASAASESPGASVAAGLRSRLNIGGDGAAATSTGSLPGKLQDRLHLGGDQQAAAQPAAAQPAAPAAPFSFVFGTAAAAGVPSPKAGRAAHRKPSPRSSPASGTRPSSAAAPAAAFQRAGSMSSTAAMPEAAPAALAAGQGPATQQAAPSAFVFGASGGSPAALRAHHRARQHSQSPSQTPSPGKAAAAAAATAPGATSEPLQASNQQQPPQPPQPQQKHGWFGPFVRLGNLGKMGSSSGSPNPGFAAAGTTARRPPSTRKKSGPPVRSPPRPTSGGMAAAAAPPPAAPAAPPATAAAPPPPAPAGPADGAAGAQEWDAPTKTAYNCCEMYRSQGNEAFRDGDYSGAYDLYTKALTALWPYPPLHPRLALLLSNRAASLLSVGKPLSALADCQMGFKHDPSLMRCALRIATCHSRMGDFDKAFESVAQLRAAAGGNTEQLAEIEAKQRDIEEAERQMYAALRMLGHDLQAPRRDPASGALLERSESTASGASMSRASSTASVAGSAAPSTADAFWAALKKIEDVAPHVPHSELVLAAKTEGLLRLGKLSRAREYARDPVHQDDGPHREQQQRAPWRLWIRAQCSWHEGDTSGGLKKELTTLAGVLEAEEAAAAQREQQGSKAQGPAAGGAASAFFPAAPATAGPLPEEQRRQAQLAQLVGLPPAAEVRALLEGLAAADRLRQAGNAAVKAGKAAEAVQKYTEALAASHGLSPAIAAVLLSNRAAAYQHLKQRAQAVADCCRSVALSPQFAKAHSRLATLLAELGYHDDAATALEAAAEAPGVSSSDRRGYQQRLQSERTAAKRAASRSGGLGGQQAPLDHYKLLGLERTTTAEEVRRTYKKLALQLHPDKAAAAVRPAVRCCGCGSPTFEAVAALQRLQEHATWLFKLLGEANEVLCDASKRRELDYALRTAGGTGGARGARAPGGFTSYYGSDEDDTDFYGGSGSGSFFGGRRTGSAGYGGASYGGASYGYSGYSHGYCAGPLPNRTGAGAGSRYWGFV